MTPKFSIIIPTYNRAELLQNTVASVQAQTVKDWELIIVDDGSTDDTVAVIKKLQEKDVRIVYVHQPNARQAQARQNGLQHATGEWITYIDSDDFVYPKYLEVASAFFHTHPELIFATANMDRTLELRDKVTGETLKTIQQPPTKKQASEITIEDYANWLIKPCGTGIFHRRAEVAKAGIVWDSSFKLLEDLDLLLQCGTAFPDGFGYIQEKIFHYIQVWGTDGVCGNASYGDFADAFEQIYQKHNTSKIMQHQQWYPQKVAKYRTLQKQFAVGEIPEPAHGIVFP